MTRLLLIAILLSPQAARRPVRPTPSPPATAATHAPTAPVAWRAARWGMSEAQVAAAFPGETKPVPASEKRGDKNLKAALMIQHVMVEDYDFSAYFLFGRDDGALRKVLLDLANADNLTPLDFQAVRRLLADKYGTPRVEFSESPAATDDTREADWVNQGTSIQLSYISRFAFGVKVRGLRIFYTPSEDKRHSNL